MITWLSQAWYDSLASGVDIDVATHPIKRFEKTSGPSTRASTIRPHMFLSAASTITITAGSYDSTPGGNIAWNMALLDPITGALVGCRLEDRGFRSGSAWRIGTFSNDVGNCNVSNKVFFGNPRGNTFTMSINCSTRVVTCTNNSTGDYALAMTSGYTDDPLKYLGCDSGRNVHIYLGGNVLSTLGNYVEFNSFSVSP
jgi:hypothetical protein